MPYANVGQRIAFEDTGSGDRALVFSNACSLRRPRPCTATGRHELIQVAARAIGRARARGATRVTA